MKTKVELRENGVPVTSIAPGEVFYLNVTPLMMVEPISSVAGVRYYVNLETGKQGYVPINRHAQVDTEAIMHTTRRRF